MNITLNKSLEFDVDEVAKSLSPREMIELFTKAANIISDGPFEPRRRLAKELLPGLSENAKRMLAEMFAAAYVQLETTQR